MNSAVQWALLVAQAVGLPALILFYLRDRRTTRAQATVAEGTTQAQIDLSSITAREAHVGLIQKAFDVERGSLQRQIDDLEERLQAALAERDRQRAELRELRGEVDRLRELVGSLTDRLQAAARRFDGQDGGP